MMSPREVPCKDDYYMGMAFFAAGRSKDPNTRVGAYIVSSINKPLGLGFNGPPSAFNDNEINWDRPYKRAFIKHAEANAIDHSDREKLNGATIYVTAMPCPPCMLDIIDAKIKRIVYFQAKNIDSDSMLARKDDIQWVVDAALKSNIKLELFNGNLNWVLEYVDSMRSLGAFDSQSA